MRWLWRGWRPARAGGPGIVDTSGEVACPLLRHGMCASPVRTAHLPAGPPKRDRTARPGERSLECPRQTGPLALSLETLTVAGVVLPAHHLWTLLDVLG